MSVDWSEPIRKKGYILNFTTKKLQEVHDGCIVSKSNSFVYFISLKHFSFQYPDKPMQISGGVREAEHAWTRNLRSGVSCT